MSGAMDTAKGRVKEAAGVITDDDDLRREGKLDQAAGTLKDAATKVKDAAEKTVDKVRHAVKGNG